ncbi:hypothetical protein NQ130_00060, partial [Klebsiella quasipneumoniae]|uniref:hypothetical protein n=2 Tax=Klebsiella quasipneumoniae TaxID=1463165 RepID=UPI0025659093
LMMSLWDALRMNMMISYQELVRTFPNMSSPFSERCDYFSVGFLRRRKEPSPAGIACERLLSRLS